MNAQPSNRPPSSSVAKPAVRARRQPRKPAYRTLALEITARLGANVLIGMVAISALVKLIPYNLEQQTKLQELQVEVGSVEKQLEELRAEFDRHFDPQQAVSTMQEQSVRVDPNQRQIIWVKPTEDVAKDPEPGERQASTKGAKLED